jgi:SSS family solute:Na+ symporter
MLFAALWAPQIREFPGIWDYLQQMLSFLVPPVVAIFLLGVFWQKVNGPAAFGTLIGGHILSLAVFLLSTDGIIFEEALIDLHFTIIAGLLTFLCMGLVVFITLSTDAEPTAEQLDDLTWAGRATEVPEEFEWYQDYRIQAAFVLSLTVAMLVVFW